MPYFFGRYEGPIARFKEYPQPNLARAYAEAKSEPLEFSFGYQWHPHRSSLMVARPATASGPYPKAEPVEQPQ
jgi:hypothetical protein